LLVSVIIPVYNGEQYLAEAIESALCQSYRPIELIVIDDGSTDRSAIIAKSYEQVIYIYQTNQGVSVARNTGLGVAQGEFIAFLDASRSGLIFSVKYNSMSLCTCFPMSAVFLVHS